MNLIIRTAQDDKNLGLSESVLFLAIQGDNDAVQKVWDRVIPYLKTTAYNATGLRYTTYEDFYDYLRHQFIRYFFKPGVIPEEYGRETERKSYFDPRKGPLKSWLFSFIRTTKIDYLKKYEGYGKKDFVNVVSYDAPLSEESDITLSDVIGDVGSVENLEVLRYAIDKAKELLDSRERKILEMLMEGYKHWTQEEIGRETGIGPERVSELINTRIKPILRRFIKDKGNYVYD